MQVIVSFSQTARASSTAKPVGLPSGRRMQRRELVVGQEPDRPPVWGASTRSPRLRGFQKFGTVTAGVAACVAAGGAALAGRIRP